MSTTTKTDQTANAIRECLISPNVSDSNFECANVVDVIHQVANAGFAIAKTIETSLKASTYTGGSENLATAIDRLACCHEDCLVSIAAAIDNLAQAIRELKTP